MTYYRWTAPLCASLALALTAPTALADTTDSQTDEHTADAIVLVVPDPEHSAADADNDPEDDAPTPEHTAGSVSQEDSDTTEDGTSDPADQPPSLSATGEESAPSDTPGIAALESPGHTTTSTLEPGAGSAALSDQNVVAASLGGSADDLHRVTSTPQIRYDSTDFIPVDWETIAANAADPTWTRQIVSQDGVPYIILRGGNVQDVTDIRTRPHAIDTPECDDSIETECLPIFAILSQNYFTTSVLTGDTVTFHPGIFGPAVPFGSGASW